MTIEQGVVAKFSPDRKYRYLLTRRVGFADDSVTFVMLNPSTADETQDDPTIRHCIAFASHWGFGWLHVVNLSPLRATDPKVLLVAGLESDAVWYENLEHIGGAALASNMVIAAWGVHGSAENRDCYVIGELRENVGMVYCLGLNKDGHPKHPLYLKADTVPEPLTRPYPFPGGKAP